MLNECIWGQARNPTPSESFHHQQIILWVLFNADILVLNFFDILAKKQLTALKNSFRIQFYG
jgi:hypothetical protein